MSAAILIGKGDDTPQRLLAQYANRHGLVAGATGTGKTVTLQILAEGFAQLGVPVFAADIKGDLSGIAAAGEAKPKLVERAATIGVESWAPAPNPTVFWDVFGTSGHPVRATVSDMGPVLLARLLDLSDVQEAVLSLVFRYADDQGLLLLDLKDLRAVLQYVGSNAKSLGTDYGLVTSGSVGAIQRALLQLESDGAEHFFGEPALDLADFMRCDMTGRGIVNVLAADVLYQKPRLYSTFLLWLLSELFERLPEAGDADKPKLVFFFDEAHLLFKDAPKALVEKVEQVVRLIRSKGVGVYFVTQNPLDLPDAVLGQLGNRVQHALRAFTPRDQKAVKAAAETFRPNPKLKVADVIQALGVGEALVSTLDEKGVPTVVEKTLIAPPRSRIGPLTADERQQVRSRSPVAGRYEQAVDRESAYEKLSVRAAPAQPAAPAAAGGDTGWWDRGSAPAPTTAGRATKPAGAAARRGDTVVEVAIKSATRSAASSIGREVGRQLLRGLLGSLSRR
ncbi:helicase HerA-like domain-containing protein [Solimonas flava]|uniref:helicase HerA-like domain-containing protein n=1 Tax=Solimonas flava TaxID=415849 RepID=UPI00041B4228|nr:helicase HerA-like domain-containing protein [Solimonas flava]